MQFRKPENYGDAEDEEAGRIYTLCYFGRHGIAPDVELIEAASDDDAVEAARHCHPFMLREVWDRHRLVAKIAADPD